MAIMIIIYLLILPALIYNIMKRRRLRRVGIRTTGIVVRHVERGREKNTYEVPVIAFFDEPGKRFEFIPPEPRPASPKARQAPRQDYAYALASHVTPYFEDTKPHDLRCEHERAVATWPSSTH